MQHRKLIEYLPEVLKDVREYKKTFESEEPEFEKLWEEVSKVLKDQFVEDATERGVKRWERQLKIVPKATETLDDRRFNLLLRLVEKLPYTYRRLDGVLEGICGKDYAIISNFDEYKIEIKINMNIKNQYENVNQLLNAIVPANLVIDLKLIFNQHKILCEYMHRKLGCFTHNQLKQDPFFVELTKNYNKHDLMNESTYNQLIEFTHNQIKSEGL